MTSPFAVRMLRQQLWQQGYRPVPVATNGKQPVGNDWPGKARRNPPLAATNEATIEALNTGILCDGLVVIDVDVDDPAIATQVERIAVEMLGGAPVRRRSDSPRVAMLYRAQSGEPLKRSIVGNLGKIEILGKGQQFVAAGIHESGVAYAWDYNPAAIHRDTLRPVGDDPITAFLTRCAPLVGADASKIKPVAPVAVSGPAPIVMTPPPPASERDKAFAAKALAENTAELRGTLSGRNDKLNRIAYRMGRFVVANHISADVVEHALMQAARDNGYVAKRSEATARRTLKSGLNSGMKEPVASTPDVAQVDISAIVNGKGKPMNLPRGKRTIEFESMDTVTPKALRWLWKNYIPAGKLTLLAGQGGAGKSTLCFDLAARISCGAPWPDGTRCATAGNVLIHSAEDDVADTILPRLIAAGCDRTKIATMKCVTDDETGNKLPFNAATDMELLRDATQRGPIALFIVDPIVSFVEGDMNKANEVRRSLQPLVDFAEETGTAIIGITHMAKHTQGRVVAERALGSRAFTDLARMVLIAAKDEETDQRVFTRAKSNNTVDTGGFAYTIVPVELASAADFPKIETTKIEWGEHLTGSSREILREIEAVEEDEGGTKGKAAQHYLRTELATEPRLAKELIAGAKTVHGISEKTLRRAQKEIGVMTHRSGFGGPWFWSLPMVDGALDRWAKNAP